MTFQLINIDPLEILLDPKTPNVRDRINDTTDLQASIREWGIQNPLEVRLESGKFVLVGGHRRLVAAKALHLKSVPCLVKDIRAEDASVLMLISDMQKAFPHIINDKDGNVVGGRAWAVHGLSSRGDRKKYEIANMIGVPADVIGAYLALVKDCLEVRRRVELGDIDITVYSLIKRQPLKFKDRLLSKRGRITATYVRRFKKKWPGIKDEPERTDAEEKRREQFEDFVENIPDLIEEGEVGDPDYTIAWCLNSAIEWIEKIGNRELEPADRFLLSNLESLIEAL